MEDVGMFYGHLVNFPTIWYIVWPFGIFSPLLVPKKNLAALSSLAFVLQFEKLRPIYTKHGFSCRTISCDTVRPKLDQC
jgi:hypothetical protein